jgi:hypothetical protein
MWPENELRDYPEPYDKWGAKSIHYYYEKFNYWWKPKYEKRGKEKCQDRYVKMKQMESG